MFPTIRFVMEAANKNGCEVAWLVTKTPRLAGNSQGPRSNVYTHIQVDCQWFCMLELIGNIKDLCDSDEALAQKVKIRNTVA